MNAESLQLLLANNQLHRLRLFAAKGLEAAWTAVLETDSQDVLAAHLSDLDLGGGSLSLE